MRSIHTRITALMVAAIVVSVLLAGGAGIYALKTENDEDSAREMEMLCANNGQTIDGYLNSVKQSVDMISRYARENMSSVELMEGGVLGFDGSGAALKDRDWGTNRQRVLDNYLTRHIRGIGPMFLSVANHTKGVVSFYYRLNPEFSRQVKGVFYFKSGASSFVETPMTDIMAYDADDTAHVGWYYQTLKRGRPSWLEPGFNANLDAKTLAFTTPIYMAGTFVGLVGMDVSFDALVSQVQDIHIFETGYASLTDADGRVLYHPEVEAGRSIEEISPGLMDTASLIRQDGSQGIAAYEINGEKKHMAFTKLSNGMRLAVVAPTREINRRWHRLVNGVISITLLVMLVFIPLMTLMMRRIIKPLKRLTSAARELTEGNYDVELDYRDQDEVGILTETFRHLVSHLRVYISDLNSMAYKDALTGIKNKSAFDLFARKLDDMIASAPADLPPRFAIVMFDCNMLKEINDQYGHDKGDVYLKTASHQICNTFNHSPVFRLGGDEFAVVLQQADFLRREKLLEEFDANSAIVNAGNPESWNQVSIAKGCAVYDPAIDANTADVLRRADEAMYRDKNSQHAATQYR
ncbi:MAG: diguanylate cyclase [Clostridia bacterium]|nr:diguanylate cyclase [Clostridia bacterium]